MILEALKPLRVRSRHGELRLLPGAPVHVSDELGTWLLDQGKVRLVELRPGCLVWWRGGAGEERGPALVRGTLMDHGAPWVWFTFQNTEYLLHVRQVVKIQDMTVTDDRT